MTVDGRWITSFRLNASSRRALRRAVRMPGPLEALRKDVLAKRREIDDAYARLAARDAELEALEEQLEAAAAEWYGDSSSMGEDIEIEDSGSDDTPAVTPDGPEPVAQRRFTAESMAASARRAGLSPAEVGLLLAPRR